MHHRSRALVALFAIAALLPFAATGATAQQTGGIRGAAVSADDGTPLPYTLIQLLPGEGEGPPLRSVLTAPDGSFGFDALQPGAYRLRLERVGFESVLTEPVTVTAGEQLEYPLRTRMTPLELRGVTVRAGGPACYALAELGQVPELEALWREVQKGVLMRQAFEVQYRYTYDRRHEGITDMRLGGDRTFARDSVVTSEPDSVLARRERLRAYRTAEGYGEENVRSFSIRGPDEVELTDNSFLTDHCLEAVPESRDGAWGLRFRPVRTRGGRIDVRGTLWLEQDSYLIRSLEVEFLRGDSPMGESRIDFSNVAVPGGTVRLPSLIWISARPGGAMRLMVASFENTWLRRNFRDIERVGARGG